MSSWKLKSRITLGDLKTFLTIIAALFIVGCSKHAEYTSKLRDIYEQALLVEAAAKANSYPAFLDRYAIYESRLQALEFKGGYNRDLHDNLIERLRKAEAGWTGVVKFIELNDATTRGRRIYAEDYVVWIMSAMDDSIGKENRDKLIDAAKSEGKSIFYDATLKEILLDSSAHHLRMAELEMEKLKK